MMDWDDLRFFLAIAREGGLRSAAERMKVSHSTVARRIQLFEDRLGVRLFDRTPDGFVLTATGERMLEPAELMEETAIEMERDVLGRDARLQGTIRITAPNVILASPLMKDLAAFCAEFTDVDLAFVHSYSFADLSRREADIALRLLSPGASPPEHLVGRKLGVSYHCVYVSKEGLTNPNDPRIIGWGDRDRHPEWIDTLPVPNVDTRHMIDDEIIQANACASGMGYAVLSCMQGDMDDRLMRVEKTDPWPGKEVWVLTHPDIRDTARFRLMRDVLGNAIKSNEHLLLGMAHTPRAKSE